MAEERLQKVMAAAGVDSRRACEELITAGRVQVDGRTVTELGTKVDPDHATILVDGRPIKQPERNVYFKVHKPRDMLSDIGGDTRGRKTVADLLPSDVRRVFPVGRLDLNSEGLVLLTDDGDLAHKLTHPRFEHPKTYYVLVETRPSGAAVHELRTGVELPDGYKTAAAGVQLAEQLPRELELAPGRTAGCWLEIVLHEGKKRQIRHMTAAVGHPTLRLVRWAIGPLVLGDLSPGESTALSRSEVTALRTFVRQPRAAKTRSAERKNRANRRSNRNGRRRFNRTRSNR